MSCVTQSVGLLLSCVCCEDGRNLCGIDRSLSTGAMRLGVCWGKCVCCGIQIVLDFGSRIVFCVVGWVWGECWVMSV